MTLKDFTQKVAFSTLTNVVALLAAPVVAAFLLRYGKRKTWLWVLGIAIPLGFIIYHFFAKNQGTEGTEDPGA